MRNFFSILIISFLSFSMLATDVQAKRFGGGKSFGVSRQTSNFSRSNIGSKPAQATTAAAAAKPSTGSKWLGPLAGLAMGGLLASLFMGHGLGAGILSWLAIGGILFLVWAFIRRRLQPTIRTNQNMSYQSLAQDVQDFPKPGAVGSSSFASSDERVTNFDESGFLRNAKSAFIRLQAAYDSSNLTDMREFLSPEVYAEIQLQLQERGNAPNQTDVISIEAELLDLSTESHMMIASVMFSGLVREEQNAEPTPIKEIWHFHKFDVKPNWLVAGIQQA